MNPVLRGGHLDISEDGAPFAGPETQPGMPFSTPWRCLEMSMATITVAAIEWVAVMAGLRRGVVVQNHC